MTSMSPQLHHVDADQLAPSSDFRTALLSLPGASVIHLEGSDRLRTRAVVTLLHSNEPSGFKAIYRIIREGVVPSTNVAIIVASIDAAQTGPLLYHHHLQTEADLNRCFTPPFDTPQRQLAAAILQYLRSLEPEVVIDTHNTSSHSEPFCVTADHTPETRLWSTLFSPRLVVLTHVA